MAAIEDLQRLRERVRVDRRTVSAPLLVFGVLVLAHTGIEVLVAMASSGPSPRHLTALVYWPLAGVVGLLALWLHAHRVAVREGVGEGPRSYRPVALGYLVSLPIIAILLIPALFVGVFAPLVWPAAIFLAIGVRQHNQTLKSIAKALCALGLVQGLLVLASTTVAGAWVMLGVEVAAGLGLVAGAVVAAQQTKTPKQPNHNQPTDTTTRSTRRPASPC